MKVVAFLPAKGTSQRIPSKNQKLLNGKPLFLHTLEKLVSCDFIDEVYLDTESDDMLNYASYLNYIPLKRDPALATNKTDGHQMFFNEVSQVDADIYIQILGTSPFIKKETIKKGIDILINHSEYDSVVLVKKDKQYLWNEDQPIYDKHHIPNSIDLPDTIIETMGLYIVRKEAALNLKMRYGDHTYLLEADPLEAIDVNFPEDFVLAEYIAKGICHEEYSHFRSLANFFNSSIFSDILHERGLHNTITGLQLNLSNKKVLGRANTLKIRDLKDGEDYRCIYKGLDTYKKICEGEIIVVSNDTGHRAYFGELNANLAVRSGAIATIVDGVTRDISEVNALDYPVFSKGYSCSDVKYMSTIESHNQPISIQGTTIYPGDLIFADLCGIVVIPKAIEKEVLEKALEIAQTEKNVLNKIMQNQEAKSIYEEEGEF